MAGGRPSAIARREVDPLGLWPGRSDGEAREGRGRAGLHATKRGGAGSRRRLEAKVGAAITCSMVIDGKTYDVAVNVTSIDGTSAKFDVAVADRPRS